MSLYSIVMVLNEKINVMKQYSIKLKTLKKVRVPIGQWGVIFFVLFANDFA